MKLDSFNPPGLRLALLVAALGQPPFAASPEQDYLIEIPARQMVSYEIEFEVVHPGHLALEASWDSTRVLSFRLEGPPGSSPVRRSGPPPLRLELDVAVELAETPGPWKLSIRGLPADQAARGRLRLMLPEPEPGEAVVVEPAEVRIPEPLPPWLHPRTAPSGALPELADLYASTERLRSHVALKRSSSRDRYAWQEALLDYLAARRDGTAALPDAATRELLARTVDATRGLEGLAASHDPLIAGPPPPESRRREAWLIVRKDRIRPVEAALDSLLHDVGHLEAREEEDPSLDWLPRFVSCLMACERHFEQRGRIGDRAVHGDIVAEQWDGLRLAADALQSLVALPSN